MSDKTYIGPIRITDSDGIPIDAYVGSNGNDTIRTSEYMPSAVWGAAGDDTIIQEGIGATYWFGQGDGHDTIVGYERTFDTVYDWSGGKGALVVFISGEDVILSPDGGQDTLTIKGIATAGKMEGDINYNIAGKSQAFLRIGTENDSDYGQGTAIQLMNIDSPAILIGGQTGSQHLYAWQGDTEMWGGGSHDDVLVGGEGKDEVWFGRGDGHDKFYEAGSEDTIFLWNVSSIDDVTLGISQTEPCAFTLTVGGDSLTAQVQAVTEDGYSSSNLRVHGTVCPEIRLADGTAYHLAGKGDSLHFVKG